MGTTRRGIFSGAAGAGAAYALGGPVLGAIAKQKPCVPTGPGVPAGAIAIEPGRGAWTTDSAATKITARRGRQLERRRSIDVGGAPVGIAISPDRRTALVTTAAYDRPGLAVVDLGSGKVKRLDVGPDPGAVAFSPDGRHAYVVGRGEKGTLTRIKLRKRRVGRPVEIGAHPRGLAVSPNGRRVVVALNGARSLAIVKPKRGRVRKIRTARYPSSVAISPDGRSAIVTHSGYGPAKASVIDLRDRSVERRVKVADDPAAVAFAENGRAIVVSRSGNAVILDRRGRRRRGLKLGGHPEAVATRGAIALVADGRSGYVHRVRLGAS